MLNLFLPTFLNILSKLLYQLNTKVRKKNWLDYARNKKSWKHKRAFTTDDASWRRSLLCVFTNW